MIARGGMTVGPVPILMYHEVSDRVSPTFRKYTVAPRTFAAQMRWLVAARYTAVGLDRLLDAREGLQSLPSRPVVITFDDGFSDCLRHAAPILHDLGLTATFYIVAGLVGRTSAWLRRERAVELPMAGWDAIARMVADGFECGAHSLTHPRLPSLTSAARRRELVESRAMLESRVGPVRHLAYPFGAYDVEVMREARAAGYRSAVSVSPGLWTPRDDPFAMARVPVSGLETFIDFMTRVRTGCSVRELVRYSGRAAMRRLRGIPSEELK